MAKEKHGPYRFLSNLVISLMNMDDMFTYDFLTAELNISKPTLSKMKKGEDMCVYQYVRLISFMLEQIHLDVFLDLLLKLMKKVFATGCSLVIGTVPRRSVGDCQLEDRGVLMKWDRGDNY